jgi:ABC-type antimicrobial peptide transport system permease subunit
VRPRDTSRAHVYLPLQQFFVPSVTIAARAEDGRRLEGELRTLVATMDPNLPILNSTTLEQSAALALLPQRAASIVSASLGAVGLLLTAMGIYGVAAFAVSQRMREIGIRMALGAQPRDVVRLVLTSAARLTFGGAALGLGVAFVAHVALTRVSAGFPAIDPLAFAGAAVLLAAFAVAACYVPARRALDLDPVATLRAE